ncbi:gamma-glutamyltransferase [Labrenzia sp. PHM005]|uniref:gamma-glutamyltransferase n=1 Tax=Labrenzia sp. PHM005 TaxID=2590016 RepID=UPI0011400B9A|nr:gamma-glutamyltransferase [Labrenzia sp. PHM005]QDG79273.1 gamma-glutamyltransferase [Labrenzia sp. PHM005]
MKRTQKGAVAAGHKLTAEAGAAMLRDGGSAVDAAIAALAMACVCEPVLASPGGGGFAMIRDGASGKTTLLDFFPQTPRQKRDDIGDGYRTIEADFGTTTQIFHIGPATVATPGFLDGLEALAKHGTRLSHQDHFAPAISAATGGVEITSYQAYLSTVVEPILMATEPSRSVFAPSGALQRAGEVFFNPALAETFKNLGQTSWRQTEIPEALLKEQGEGGHITEADLRQYGVEERSPLSLSAGNAKLFLNPLPAASGTLIQYALRYLETCAPLSLAKALDTADQARLSARGDLSVLLDHPLRQKGTTHISAVDADGNACSVTVSNGTGSGEMAGGCGFMLNNILGEDDVNPDGALGWPVNTRPASMMCPTLLDMPDGRLIALGSGGSSRIRSAVFQAVAHLGLNGADIHTAVEAPRLHVEEGHLDAEALLDESDLTLLAGTFADHRFWPQKNMFFGGVHAVQFDPVSGFDGVGDARREGAAIVVN